MRLESPEASEAHNGPGRVISDGTQVVSPVACTQHDGAGSIADEAQPETTVHYSADRQADDIVDLLSGNKASYIAVAGDTASVTVQPVVVLATVDDAVFRSDFASDAESPDHSA